MLIRTSQLQWVQLGAWYYFQLGYCVICWVPVLLGNIGSENHSSKDLEAIFLEI